MNVKPENLYSLAAEAAVLGSMIIDPKCIGDILPLLDEKSFFEENHKTIYNSLVTLFIANIPVDAIPLRDDLESLNLLEKVGGVKYISELMQSVPHSANALYYARIVKERQRFRELVLVVDKIQAVPDEPISVDEQLERIQSLALGLEQDKSKAEYFTFADDVERIAAEVQEQQPYIPTGLRNIDNIIGGVSPGELVILAGRPSMGKSALALNFVLNMSGTGLSIIIFTLEMTHKGLINRALQQEQAAALKGLDIVLHERADTPEKQIAFIKKRKQTHKVDIVVVDYLQLMHTGAKNENRTQEISTISRKLKLLAVQEGLPIIALSQLNRQVESRDKHRPRLSDLRDSGSIEQDSDIVMLISREDYYRKNEDPKAPQDGSTEIIIAKNRRGPTGVAQLVFLDSQVKFGDKNHYE